MHLVSCPRNRVVAEGDFYAVPSEDTHFPGLRSVKRLLNGCKTETICYRSWEVLAAERVFLLLLGEGLAGFGTAVLQYSHIKKVLRA